MSEANLAKSNETGINFKRNFFLLFMGLVVSMLGNGIFRFGLNLYVLDITKSEMAFTIVTIIAFLPDIIVNLLGSAYVDNHDRKKILVSADILSGVVVLAFMFIANAPANFMLWVILCSILLSFFNNFFRLSLMASIPNIVGEESVLRAQSTMQGLNAFLAIIGPVMGALVYKNFGIELVFILNGLSFILSGISEMFIRFRKIETEADETPYFTRVKEGFQYIAGHSVLKFFMVFAFFMNTIYLPLTAQLLVIIAYSILGLSAIQLSIIQGAWAFGMILGSVFVGVFNKPKAIISKFFILLQIQSLLVVMWYFPRLSFFADASHWVLTGVYALILCATGTLNIIQNAPLLAHFQVEIPDKIRGRVFGVLNLALLASAPVGIGVFMLASRFIDWMLIPVISGILMFAYCIYSARNKAFGEFIHSLKEEINQPATEEQVAESV